MFQIVEDKNNQYYNAQGIENEVLVIFIRYNLKQARKEKKNTFLSGPKNRLTSILYILYAGLIIWNFVRSAIFSYNTLGVDSFFISISFASLLLVFLIYRELILLTSKRV